MYIGEEPKTLEECFERLKKWCRRLSEECGYSDDYSVFKLPATEDEIKRYEGNNNIVLPEDYKKFLRFSNGAEIMGNWMTIYGLGKCGFRDEMVPEYYFVIGEQVGDGERIAFDPETKEIFSFYDGDMTPWKIEDEMKRLLDECEEILLTNDVKQEMDLQKSNGKTQEQMKKEMYARIDALYKEAMKKYSNKNKDDQK